jgi:phosphatidylglycerol:prolipoprotein diacylglycerol transferase
MYLLAFLQFWWLGRQRILTHPQLSQAGWTVQQLDDLLFYGVLGVIARRPLSGRCLLYEPGYYLAQPLQISRRLAGRHVVSRGISRCAARDGAVRAQNWQELARDHRLHCAAGAARPGCRAHRQLYQRRAVGTCGRSILAVGNGFPWVDDLPRHPSQLYQAGLEGLALFVLLWTYSGQTRARGAVSGVFLMGYGVLRWIAEYFRSPDEGIFGFSYTVSMGQWLSLPMIVAGIIFVVVANRQRN